jgi:hypothetical protein
MKHDIPSPEDIPRQRAERHAALVQALTVVNQARRTTMAPERFRQMIERMAEQQLIYEEFGREPR